jgi:hypothetical protein
VGVEWGKNGGKARKLYSAFRPRRFSETAEPMNHLAHLFLAGGCAASLMGNNTGE